MFRKNAKTQKTQREAQKPLDTSSPKKQRGRPPRMRGSEIWGRAENYRGIFKYIWDALRTPLLEAGTEDEVIQAFEKYGQAYAREFIPHQAGLILKVIHDPNFPKTPEPQMNFLADSIAALGRVSPRRSRDIAAQERARYRAKTKHHILRHEFYVECSCGYKGPARDSACRKCGAEIPPSLGGLVGSEFS